MIDAVFGTALMDIYAKCGRLDMAWDVFEKIKKDVFTWNAINCGLAMYSRAEDAIKLFFKMQRQKFRPNGITLVGVPSAFAHSGMGDFQFYEGSVWYCP
jgi:pentatricopeptide repeat protein